MRKAIRDLAQKYRLEESPANRLQQFRGEHAGLILQRYLAEQQPAEGDRSPQAGEQKKRALAERQAILHSAINAAHSENVRALYKQAFDRWQKSLKEFQALPQVLETQGRLIVGLGSENVLETGIRLHHIYGLPILPGSALKGLAAHYCDQVWRRSDDKFKKGGTYHAILFGTTDDSGCIAFHDAWYVPDSSQHPLVLDVMTPHHSKWNDISNPVAPTDFDSPIPVPFLSITGKFLIAVSWNGPASEKSTKWTPFALSLLTQALAEWGIGGKASSGYGRLGVATDDTPKVGERASSKVSTPNDGRVEVEILEAKPETGASAFRVQETGKKPGMLNHGTPPDPLPAVGTIVRVYPAVNSQPNNPSYRWSKQETGHQQRKQGPKWKGKR